MEQELISNPHIAIIGAGPSGCICAKFLIDEGFNVTLFDKGEILHTLLPTGGGKCNLAPAQFYFKELSKNYPRGEKFLYSVFSKFGVNDTLEFFEHLGVKTYTRADKRIFPTSNSSKDVQEKFVKALKGIKFIKENIIEIIPKSNKYSVKTNKDSYDFDVLVIAIGGHAGVQILKNFNLKINEQTQALVGLTTQKDYSELAGVSFKNIKCENYQGDILFTHKGISGPLIYTISSIHARKEFPYKLKLKLMEDVDFQDLLNKNSHKEIKNLVGQFVPKSFAKYLLEDLNIAPDTMCHKIDGKTRNRITNTLYNFEITVTGKVSDGEVVTCGGIDLKEINPKTMEAKKYPNLYFCGEILDIDGFCGGYNLQSCWSTGAIAAKSIISNFLV
ncbi:aminoacetone oxidase family FAD-binding enzyme [bacterium]|nr:aminoacetone oxidase family FAD-binding enzyme [bacterium]